MDIDKSPIDDMYLFVIPAEAGIQDYPGVGREPVLDPVFQRGDGGLMQTSPESSDISMQFSQDFGTDVKSSLS